MDYFSNLTIGCQLQSKKRCHFRVHGVFIQSGKTGFYFAFLVFNDSCLLNTYSTINTANT